MTTVGGRYEIGEVIGRGGMAEVMRGTDVRLSRDVAVKVLREDLARDPAFQARFRREAQSAASLDAPTIVAVYDTGVDERGVPWIVMEYVDGRTLRDVLSTEGRLLPQRALEITADICSALDAAHAAGMVHRDIKPANVMLTSRGEVKVMDFGIAQAAAGTESTMTQTQAIIGTAAYLSPEQARGEHVDARSDLYSTGCLLYELVTGRPPFIGDSPVAVAYQHVREDPVPPSQYDETLTPLAAANLDAVVLKAMAKNPANRYSSADEMREDVLRAVAGQPVEATPVLSADVAASVAAAKVVVAPARRSARFAYSVFAVVLLVLALGSALLVRALLSNDSNLIKPPPVLGMTQVVAIQSLATYGLRVDNINAAYSTKPVGTVIAQSPDANFLVPKNGTVDLTISQGPERASVPRIIGRTQADAEADLKAVKLVAVIVMRDVKAAAGQVLNVSPAPGTVLGIGSSVTVLVASGNVPVPDVRSMTQEMAIAALGQAGFGIGIRLVPSTITPGTVLDQRPFGGVAPLGSDVVIDVAGDPATTPPPDGSAPPSPSPAPTTPAPTP